MFDNYTVNSTNAGLFDIYIVSIDVDQIEMEEVGKTSRNPHIFGRNSANKRSSNSRNKSFRSGCLKVQLNMCAKINDPVKYFSNQENMDMKIAVMQVTDADIRKKITANPVAYAQTRAKNIKSKFISSKVLSLFDSVDVGIANFISISKETYTANGNVKNTLNERPYIPYTKKVDSNGFEYYEVPIKAQFIIGEHEGGASVRDLSYFCYPFVDSEEKYLDRKREQKTVVKSFSKNLFVKSKSIGNIKSEIVIKNGKIEKKCKLFVDETGNIWARPVHMMPDGKFMKGHEHARNPKSSDYLQSFDLANLKIRDNRIFTEIKRRRIDQNLISQAQIQESLTPSPVFSDLYLSRDKSGSVRYMFSLNLEEAVKQSTTYPSLITGLKITNPRAYSRIMQSAVVDNLSVSKKRIKDGGDINSIKQYALKNSDLSPADPFGIEQKHVVVQAAAKSATDLQTLTTTVVPRNENGLDSESKPSGNIRELINVKSSNSLEIKHYSGVDLDSARLSSGIYQYSVDLTLKDPVHNFLTTVAQSLENILGDMGTSSSSNLTVGSYINDVQTHPYYYDQLLDRFKPEFLRYYNSKYVSGGRHSFILEAIRNYASILFTLVDSNNFGYSPSDVVNYLCLICSPNTGGIQGITKFAELLTDLLSQINHLISVQSYVKKKSGEGQIANNRTNVTKSKEQKTNTFTKKFGNLYDFSDPSTVGFDYLYLDPKERELNNDSLTRVTKKQMKNRFSAEMNKFFTNDVTNEDIKISNRDGDVLNPNDKLENTKYTYLSPSNVFLSNSENSTQFANTSCKISSQDSNMLNKILAGIINYNNSKRLDKFNPLQQQNDKEYIEAMLIKGAEEGMTDEELRELQKQLTLAAAKQAKLSGTGDVPAGDQPDDGSPPAGAMMTNKSVTPTTGGDRDRFFEMLSSTSDGGMLDECNNIDNYLFQKQSGFGASYYVKQLTKSLCEQSSTAKTPPLNMAPIHLKALMLLINGASSVKNNPILNASSGASASENIEILKNPESYGFFQLNYKLLKQVQVFRGYRSESQKTFVNNPVFTPMKTSDLDMLKNGNLICRLADMTDVGRCVDSNSKLKLPPYNDIFIITGGSDNNKTGYDGKYLFDGPFNFGSTLYGGRFTDDMKGINDLINQKTLFTDKLSCKSGEAPVFSEASHGNIMSEIPKVIDIMSKSSDKADVEDMPSGKFFDHLVKMGFGDMLPEKIKNNPKYKTPSMQYMKKTTGTGVNLTSGTQTTGTTPTGGGSSY